MWSSFGSPQPLCQAGAQPGQIQTIGQHNPSGCTAQSTAPSQGAEPQSFRLSAKCARLLRCRALG